jgi:prepilin-type N-terminal cleavage/methylation domain-containing protein
MKLRTANSKSQIGQAHGGGQLPHSAFRIPRYFRAFTLIEIMVALAVFTMVIGAVYSAWMLLVRSTQASQDVASQAQRQRITLRTIEDALMAVQSFQASPQYYSFVVENGNAAALSFTAKVPEVFPRNGKFDDPVSGRDFRLRRLIFSLESGQDRSQNLVLRQNPILMDLDEDETQFPLVLAKNVHKFTIECWDTNKLEWLDEWENTNAIPTLLRVKLVLGSTTSTDPSAPEFSVSRMLSLPSQMMPASAQNGQGVGPGGRGSGPRMVIPTPGANPARR